LGWFTSHQDTRNTKHRLSSGAFLISGFHIEDEKYGRREARVSAGIPIKLIMFLIKKSNGGMNGGAALLQLPVFPYFSSSCEKKEITSA
jgi:hypothetical protein